MTYKEIEEMIETVDRNGDGRISYSEFRSGAVGRSRFFLLVEPVPKV